MRALTETEIAQLHEFAVQNGTGWKEALCFKFWMKGLPVPDFELLYGLRNSHGPSWLNDYKLPLDVLKRVAATDEFNKLSHAMRRCLLKAPFEITTWGGKAMTSIPGREAGATMRTVTALVDRGFLKTSAAGRGTTRYERAK